MKKIIYILIGLMMVGTVLYGEGYEKYIEIGGDVKSIGEYYFDGETFGITAFDFKNKIYTIDAKNVSTSHLCAFGDYTYSWDENTIAIGACTSPSGHARKIFIINKNGDKLNLVGVLAQKWNYIAEVKNPIDTNTKWQLCDWDEDGKKELLIKTGNPDDEIGYVFIEIGNKNISVDYNKKNYKKIKSMIKSKKEIKFNNKFINEKVSKKEIEKLFRFDNVKNYTLFKKEESGQGILKMEDKER